MEASALNNKFFLNRKIPVYWALILTLLILFGIDQISKQFSTATVVQETKKTKCITPLTLVREHDYKLTHPLLMSYMKEEDNKYIPLKEKLVGFIENAKKNSKAQSVSIYYCSLNDNTQFSINKKETYNPTHLMEVSKMIALLKQNEKSRGLLERKVLYDKLPNVEKSRYDNIILENGKYYTIGSLVYNMIANSDENATISLNQYLDHDVLRSVYKAFGCPMPDKNEKDYLMNVQDCSRPIKVLYNAGFLTINSAEYAMEVLTHSNYKDGIMKQLDTGVVVAHHFSLTKTAKNLQLHEFGIVYCNNHPYLLGIMTKGANEVELSQIISTISKMIFDEMNKVS
ncbi:MAG: serine hydrolase [Bacteroidota bacterium]